MWFFASHKARAKTANPARRYQYRPRLEALEDRRLLSAGALDPTFNPRGNPPGTAHIAIPYGNNNGSYAVLVQPASGKVVVAGLSSTLSGGSSQFALGCLNADGSLDTTFGSGGTVATTTQTTKQGYNNAQCGYAATLYPTGTTGDEKILQVGFGEDIIRKSYAYVVAVVRFNANGSLDTSFGSGGYVFTTLSQSTVGATGVVLEPNGTSLPKIVVVAYQSSFILLMRYNSDGSLDTTFGSNGVTYTQTTGTSGFKHLALDAATGDLIVTGGPGFIAAYTANGILDPSFGGTGLVYTAAGGWVATQSDGKIVVSGSHNLARYNTNGSLDASFGNGGVVTGAPAGPVAIQANGQIVVNGTARYNSDGSLDATYGTGNTVGTGWGLAIESNGDIVTCYMGFTAARRLPSQPVIGSFTASSNPIPSGSSETLTVSNLTDGNANATITQVAFYYIDGSGNQQLLGYGTQTSPGVWTFTFTVSRPAGSYTLEAQAEDSYGVFGPDATLTLQVT
jgi:uncharacterized delta-60 repeat protein